jgi:nucleoid DNA-binding protein
MTKAELIERIARSRALPPEITKKDIAAILGVAFEELAAYFARAKVTRQQSPRFTFPRFGTFTKKRRSARRGVNPRTLEPITIDACHTIDFKASRELRDSMNAAGDAATSRAAPKRTVATAAVEAKPGRASSTKESVKPRGAAKRNAPVEEGGPMARGRRLTPRDEDAEIDALIDDEDLFEELPAAPLQRVRPAPRRARTG